MKLPLRPVVVIALALALDVGDASAQPPAPPWSFSALNTRVVAGDVVYVTDLSGATFKGKFVALTDSSVQVRDKSRVRTVCTAEVRRIARQQPDSPLTGVLIGAALGAAPGIYWLVADPNECTGLCPEDYVAIGVGAVVGGLIDRALHKKVTVYEAGQPTSRLPRFTMAPVVTHRYAAVRVSLKFGPAMGLRGLRRVSSGRYNQGFPPSTYWDVVQR
jgi:hypothetical protein